MPISDQSLFSSLAGRKKGSTPAYVHIQQALREAILNNKLPSGARIPSVQKLAKLCETSVFTIQSALEPLVQEGLLERTPKLGTFVRPIHGQVTSVGLYFGSDFWHAPQMLFYRQLYEELTREMTSQNIRHRVWIDSRPHHKHHLPMPEITRALQCREIQGLIVGIHSKIEYAWLRSLKSPVSLVSHIVSPRSVAFDMAQIARDGLTALHRQGCRRISVIAPFSSEKPKGFESEALFFHRSLRATAKKLNLTLRPSLLRFPSRPLDSMHYEEFGFNEFRKIWKTSRHPDGVLVYPDTIVRGVIMAALVENVDVPKDLKLILHRNEGIPLLCPFEVAWIVSSPKQMAAAIIRHLKDQILSNKRGIFRVSSEFRSFADKDRA